MVERARRELGQLGGQLGGRLVGAVDEGVRIAQLAHLIGDGPRHAFAAVADVHAPQAADAVEIAASRGIRDIGAFGLANDQRALALERIEMGPRMQEMILVLLPEGSRRRLVRVPMTL